MELLVFAIIFTVTGAQENLLNGPENTLSAVGLNVTLKCLSPNAGCKEINWFKHNSSNQMTVFKNDQIFGAYKARYSVDNSFGCHLVVRNVELRDAGRFICEAIISSNTVDKSANLIVLETQPKCTTNASSNDTVEGERVQLNCLLSNIETSNASMAWKGVTDAQNALVNGNNISRAHVLSASAPEVPSFICITSIPVENTIIINGSANNIPNITCATPAIKVLYSVRNLTFSPLLTNGAGSAINCTAEGRPPPTFKWQELYNDGTWVDIQNQIGSVFTNVSEVATKRQVRCVAMNDVRGKSYIQTSDGFRVHHDKDGGINISFIPPQTPSTTTASEDYTWDIYVTYAAGGFLILIILLVIVCFCVRDCPAYKRCRSGQKLKDNKRKSQSLTDDPEIYCVIDEVPDFAPIAKKPKLAPTIKPPKLPTKDQPLPEVPNCASKAKPRSAPTIKFRKQQGPPATVKPLPELPQCSLEAKPISVPTIKPPKPQGPPTKAKPRPEVPPKASKAKQPKLGTPFRLPKLQRPSTAKIKPAPPTPKTKPSPDVPSSTSKAKPIPAPTSQPLKLPVPPKPVKPSPDVERSAPKVKPISVPTSKLLKLPVLPMLAKPSPDVPSSAPKAKPISVPTSKLLKLPILPTFAKPSPVVPSTAPKAKPISVPTNNLLKLPVLPTLAKPSPDVPSTAPKAKPIPASASKSPKPQAPPPTAKPCNGNPTAGHTDDYQDVYLPINHVEEEEEEYTCLTTGEDPNVYEAF